MAEQWFCNPCKAMCASAGKHATRHMNTGETRPSSLPPLTPIFPDLLHEFPYAIPYTFSPPIQVS